MPDAPETTPPPPLTCFADAGSPDPPPNGSLYEQFQQLRLGRASKQMNKNTRDPNVMKTNYLSAPATALDTSPVTIAAWDRRSPAISQKRTKVRGTGFAFLLAAFLGSCVTTELRAQVVVVPNSLTTSDGDDSVTTPPGAASLRSLQIHDASQFGALSGPSFLTQFAFRPDKILGQSGPLSWTSLRVYASTTSRSVAGLSTTFADNLGTNNVLVFDGTNSVHL